MTDQIESKHESSWTEIANEDPDRKQKIIDLKLEGNQQFKLGNYEESIRFYLDSLDLCTEQNDDNNDNDNDRQTIVILYSNLAAAKDHLQLYDEAIEYCDKALAINDSHSKAIIRRAQLYRKLDKLDESMADYKRFVELNPDDKSILPIIHELQCQIDERNEKLKAEMLTKLKDLGNVVLKPFGLSTDNFKLVKNPETGGYSVDFQKNQ
ncbi:cytochrome c oxidase subunit 1 [Dermatophagoides pteronyssinus]|uniref:Cytochrome c oxidase subunit 1 n=1 Tax=Dermatophagoides pteronyssinus TaxID=6956 RepID=A0ABQ8IXS1_DERPT|nr:cytochrome c oxidase subunit 1 [Dermatophagoides pteronyssinus]